MSASLNARQESFCRLLVLGRSAAAAAREAGYAEATARSHGWRLLQDPTIRARLDELRADREAGDRMVCGKLWANVEHVIQRAIAMGYHGETLRAVQVQLKLYQTLGLPAPAADLDEVAGLAEAEPIDADETADTVGWGEPRDPRHDRAAPAGDDEDANLPAQNATTGVDVAEGVGLREGSAQPTVPAASGVRVFDELEDAGLDIDDGEVPTPENPLPDDPSPTYLESYGAHFADLHVIRDINDIVRILQKASLCTYLRQRRRDAAADPDACPPAWLPGDRKTFSARARAGRPREADGGETLTFVDADAEMPEEDPTPENPFPANPSERYLNGLGSRLEHMRHTEDPQLRLAILHKSLHCTYLRRQKRLRQKRREGSAAVQP